MSGRRFQRRGVVLCLALVASALGAPPVAADREVELERLRAAIETRRQRVTRYEREERGLLEVVESLDETAELLEREVARASEKAETAQAALGRIESEAEGLELRLAQTERAMAERAAALYRAGELGMLRLLFGAGGMREFLTRVSALRRLLRHDAELLDRHREQSLALAEARRAAEEASLASAAARAEVAQRSAELAGERAAKRQVVQQLGASRARERAALGELETARRALEATLAELGSVAADATETLAGPSFASLEGRLEPPVRAAIAGAFGRVIDEEFLTETFRKGVEFDAAIGTPVRAVAAGQVRFAGRFRGYGNLVILDHGEGYFTVSGYLSRIDVSPGESVTAGQPIALSGESGSLAGPRLYFELRRAGSALDPEPWFAPFGRSPPKG